MRNVHLKKFIRLPSTVRHLYALYRDGQDSSACCAGGLLERQAAMRGDDIALKFADRRFTWTQVNAEANRVAAFATESGLHAGDCVAICTENCPEMLFLIAGLNKCGVISSVINPQLTGSPLVHALRQSGAKLVISEPATVSAVQDACKDAFDAPTPVYLVGVGLRDVLAQSVPVLDSALPARAGNPPQTAGQRGRDVMMYLFTSGTTGLPKAAIIRNRRFVAAANGVAGVLMQADDSDVIYLTLPLYHATGAIAGWGVSLASGAALAMRRRFSATHFWDDCVAFDATITNYIGELCRYLLAAPRHPLERKHRLRLAVGAGLRADIWQTFLERFAIPEIVEFYGSTEGNVGLANLSGRPGMIGKLRSGIKVALVDPQTELPVLSPSGGLMAAGVGQRGLLIGRISQLTPFDGYLDRDRNADKVFRNAFGGGIDWFNTGDLVDVHAGKWVSFSDRIGDTYRWKGENVSTLEVADLVAGCKGVMEANVYGIAIPNTDGRAGMVAMVNDHEFSMAEFSAEVVRRIPVHLRPAFLRIQERMVTTSSFKYIKTALRDESADPGVISDPLFYFSTSESRYVPLDPIAWRRICSGEIRL